MFQLVRSPERKFTCYDMSINKLLCPGESARDNSFERSHTITFIIIK
jgi:hypothetical protein